MKLSKTQTALIKKMQAGEKLHYMPYTGSCNSYFFCGIGNKCTATANALIDKGLVEKTGEFWKPKYLLSEAGKAWREVPA